MATTQLEVDLENEIYKGIWIDHSYSKIYGATLTLSRRDGGVLIAFLAIFISAAGVDFWRIVRYSLHRYLSSSAPSDGPYHQLQAVLRNSEIAHRAAFQLLCMLHAWRKRSKRLYVRLLPIAMVASMTWIGFMIASIFSSRVTTSQSNAVLISGRSCGNMSQEQISMGNMSRSINKNAADALSYAKQCYRRKDGSRLDVCKRFQVPKLPYSIDKQATCPFDPKICQLKDRNILIDSGYIDSHTHLGLNGGPQLAIRIKRHCAPLITEGYYDYHEDPKQPQIRVARYHYGTFNNSGHMEDYNMQISFNQNSRQSTLRQEVVSSRLANDYRVTAVTPYNASWVIPQLRQENASVALMFLDSSQIWSLFEIRDPWLAATRPMELLDVNNTVFIPEEPAGVLACSSKVTYCKGDSYKSQPANDCSDIYPFLDSHKNFLKLWVDDSQRAQVAGIVQALNADIVFSPTGVYYTRGAPSLLSRDTLTLEGIQREEIPIDRWQDEVEYSFQGSLAAVQFSMMNHARADVSGLMSQECGVDFECERLCFNQKFRSSLHYSFSLLGVCVVLVIGGIIMIVGNFTESIDTWISRFRLRKSPSRKESYGQLEWKAMSYLQLQRHVHEPLVQTAWHRACDRIPITEAGGLLGVLDTTNPTHPRYTCPPPSNDHRPKEVRDNEFEDTGSVSSVSKEHSQVVIDYV